MKDTHVTAIEGSEIERTVSNLPSSSNIGLFDTRIRMIFHHLK
jgi:hypothetical protein